MLRSARGAKARTSRGTRVALRVGRMLRAAFVLAVAASCAVPHAGEPRGPAYKVNGIAIGFGAFFAAPAAAVAISCRDADPPCGGGGEYLIFGSAMIVAGLVGITATALGVTCPEEKSIWTCSKKRPAATAAPRIDPSSGTRPASTAP